MKPFRTLDLAVDVNAQASALKVKGHLRDQLLRACSSIALNLSEGNAKFSVAEKKRFYQIAYASQKEAQTILKLIGVNDTPLNGHLDHLGASIYRLMQSKFTSLKPGA